MPAWRRSRPAAFHPEQPYGFRPTAAVSLNLTSLPKQTSIVTWCRGVEIAHPRTLEADKQRQVASIASTASSTQVRQLSYATIALESHWAGAATFVRRPFIPSR